MASRLFLVYVLVELAAVVALASTIGLGWTLLVLLGTFVIGTALAGSQVKRHLTGLRSPLTTSGTLSDGALVAVGTLLVVVPGLVTTAAGVLLLWPPTRAAARPVVTAMALRGIGRPLMTASRRSHHDVIDGEVIDVIDVDPPVLP